MGWHQLSKKYNKAIEESGYRNAFEASETIEENLKNDEDAYIYFGNRSFIHEGRNCGNLYYCGRSLGYLKMGIDTDGICGPNNGSQCSSCQRAQTKFSFH